MTKPDPKRLLELVVIADCGSITRAAELLNVSQPALSKSMSILEQSFGAKLLVRDRRGIELTECGKALIAYARSMNSILARATEQVTLMRKGLSGKLVVGIRPNAAVFIVPEVLRRSCQTNATRSLQGQAS
ncbi:LysR family transcriptional regulator [Frigidibacter oleivorans]|uniref:LysR family transcriptional regulator n=1 Tax=Frigidibacter oleivorans TaxID=2487129 RepID=UPI000F8E7A0E|nr:LysR family transcriptional regulator [Frigidibacter oleivorans]